MASEQAEGAVVPQVVAVIAALLVGFGAVSGVVGRSWLTGPMIFTAVGLVVGPAGLDVVPFAPDSEGVKILGELTLAVVLFVDAVRIDPSRLRRQAGLPLRMLLVGFPLTVAAGALAATSVLGLPWAAALVLAATLAPTDAALGQAVVTDRSVPVRIRQTLNVESGLNDGLAVPFVTAGIAAVAVTMGASAEAARTAAGWVAFVSGQIGLGVVVGLALGVGGARSSLWARRAGWMDGLWRQVSPLALSLLAWGLADVVGGNGFIAAFVGGLAFGAVIPDQDEDVTDFSEDEGMLVTLLVFLLFGVALLGPALVDGVGAATVAYALLSLTVVRMLPVAVSLVRAGLLGRSVAFLGWFGPRGLASIVFALLVAEEVGGEVGREVEHIATVTVGLSILLHGLTARPLARRYGVWAEEHRRSHADMPEHVPVPERHLGRAAG